MPCGKESSPRIAIGRKLLTEEPSCEAEDMTAPTTRATPKIALDQRAASRHDNARSRALPSRLFERSIMPELQPPSSVVPRAAIERPACPRCHAQMMLACCQHSWAPTCVRLSVLRAIMCLGSFVRMKTRCNQFPTPIHSRHIVRRAAMITGPRKRPTIPNDCIPPKIPISTNRNGSRAAPPISAG
jgi:hypothetical protein